MVVSSLPPRCRVLLDEREVPVRAWVRSASHPEVEYELERSVAGRWSHIGSECPGFTNRGHCYHTEALNRMTEETTTAVDIPRADALAVIEALDDQQIITALEAANADAVATWCYEFQQDGQPVVGLSIDAVQEAAREMARRGDVIEQEYVKLDRETDTEAFFTAKAVRWAVSADGQRVQMDSAIRSKRVEKWTKLRNPRVVDGKAITHVPNRYWYEVGTAKAARNAVEALLPEGIKAWMMRQAREQGAIRSLPPKLTNGGGRAVEAPANRQKAPRRAQEHAEPPKAPQPAETPVDPARAAIRRILTDAVRGKGPGAEGVHPATVAAKQNELRRKYPYAHEDEGNGRLTIAKLRDEDADAIAADLADWYARVGAEAEPEPEPDEGEYREVDE